MRILGLRWLTSLAPLLWLLAPVHAADSLVLAPHLGDNMVVQSNADTYFYGLAAPGEKVRVQIKGRRSAFTRPVKADAKGNWAREISFGGPSLQPLEIEIFLGEEKEPARTLRNVLVGEVWVAAIAFGQGVSVTNRAAPALRYIKVETLTPGERIEGSAKWLAADPEGLSQGYFDLLAFEHALRVSNKGIPVGVIHIPAADLVAAAREGPGAFPLDFEELFKKVQEQTRSEILLRGSRVRSNKRAGKVVEIPRINLYEKHYLYTPSQFRVKSDPSARLKAAGAIGPELKDRKQP